MSMWGKTLTEYLQPVDDVTVHEEWTYVYIHWQTGEHFHSGPTRRQIAESIIANHPPLGNGKVTHKLVKRTVTITPWEVVDDVGEPVD